MDPTLEAKYRSLMQRIEHKPSFNYLASPEDNSHLSSGNTDAKKKNGASGHDDKIKTLYDESVAFKNELADLRTRIKKLQQQSTKYSSKVDVRGF